MDRRQADAGHHRLKKQAWLTGAVLLAAALPGAALAQEREPTEHGVFSLAVENDSLSSGDDDNYTSGIKFAYISPRERLPGFLRGAGRLAGSISGANADFWGVAIGQSIFTPQDIAAVPAPPDQHPYAGWLYAQFMIAVEDDPAPGRSARWLDTYELEIGIVGPSALGEEAQSGIHQILGAPEPLGWDSQLHDELAFAVSYDRRWRALRAFGDVVPGGLEADLTPNAGVTLGTLRTEAHVGLIARIGQRIDNDYGPPRVRPSLAGVEHFYGGPPSWSVFAGVQGRAVARNLFLDGNTFEDSASVDREPLVADFQLGASFSYANWRVAYTYVWRTDEFETQGATQDFGALALSIRL